MRQLTALNFAARCLVLSVGLTAAAVAAATAQPISFDPDDPAPTFVPFRAEPRLGEHVARAEGTVDAEGKRLYLKGLDVMSPLMIRVFAKDESKPIDVSLHRFFWKESERKGTTSRAGDWMYLGRVHDEVGIELRASEPSEYYVLAWMGPAVRPEFGANVFASPEAIAAGAVGSVGDPMASPSSSSMPWLLALVALGVVVLGFVVFRARRARPVTLVILALAAGPLCRAASADAFGARLAAAEQAILTNQQAILNEMQRRMEGDNERNGRLQRIEEFAGELQAEVWESENRRARANNEMNRRLDGVEEVAGQNQRDIIESENRRIRADNEVNQEIDAIWQQLELLSEEDEVAIPDPTHGGVAPMPSRCFDNPRCRTCFSATTQKLNQRLAGFDQMRSIYQTSDRYLRRMMDLGDARSGWHQLEQAQWYSTKQQIAAAHERLRQAYRNKYDEFNGNLRAILKDYGKCEQKYGLDDWYNRYGAAFHQALTASYRLP